MATDRRRLQGPASGTSPIIPVSQLSQPGSIPKPKRRRAPLEPRKIFLQLGLTTHATSSAYIELVPSADPYTPTITARTRPVPKISVSLNGPKPLARSSPFAPTLHLTAFVKLAPFALPQRRGHIRDSLERDLSGHLETALRAAVIGERWPKAAVEVAVTVLELEEGNAGLMSALAACISAGGAALADSGIDCVDVLAGGSAALVALSDKQPQVVTDISPDEHDDVRALCCVGYLGARDELAEVWLRGDAGAQTEDLIDGAVAAAKAARAVSAEVLRESAHARDAAAKELEQIREEKG